MKKTVVRVRTTYGNKDFRDCLINAIKASSKKIAS